MNTKTLEKKVEEFLAEAKNKTIRDTRDRTVVKLAQKLGLNYGDGDEIEFVFDVLCKMRDEGRLEFEDYGYNRVPNISLIV